MIKLKALLLFALLAAFIFTLAGCGMLATESTEPEVEEAEVLKGLPEWLLLAHRDSNDLADEEEDLFLPKEEEEEAEAEEEAEEPEPAPETAAPDPAPAQQPAPASPPADDGSDAEVEESGGLTKSQQMLADSWERQRAESSDDDDDDDDGDWWDPAKKDFTHDFWER